MPNGGTWKKPLAWLAVGVVCVILLIHLVGSWNDSGDGLRRAHPWWIGARGLVALFKGGTLKGLAKGLLATGVAVVVGRQALAGKQGTQK